MSCTPSNHKEKTIARRSPFHHLFPQLPKHIDRLKFVRSFFLPKFSEICHKKDKIAENAEMCGKTSHSYTVQFSRCCLVGPTFLHCGCIAQKMSQLVENASFQTKVEKNVKVFVGLFSIFSSYVSGTLRRRILSIHFCLTQT